MAFTVLLEQKSDAVSTDFVLGLYGTNKALSSWGFDMKGCKYNWKLLIKLNIKYSLVEKFYVKFEEEMNSKR